MALRFAIDDEKALEALTLVANEWAGITYFFVAKVFFFAEKWHLNRYGRPIVGDVYVAMKNGPVPSAIYDIIRGDYDFEENPAAIAEAIGIDRREHQIFPKRQPRADVLSETDVECLTEAIAFCRGQSFGKLSDLTHREPAWREAWDNFPNSPMDAALMIDDGPDQPEKLEAAREFARFGLF